LIYLAKGKRGEGGEYKGEDRQDLKHREKKDGKSFNHGGRTRWEREGILSIISADSKGCALLRWGKVCKSSGKGKVGGGGADDQTAEAVVEKVDHTKGTSNYVREKKEDIQPCWRQTLALRKRGGDCTLKRAQNRLKKKEKFKTSEGKMDVKKQKKAGPIVRSIKKKGRETTRPGEGSLLLRKEKMKVKKQIPPFLWEKEIHSGPGRGGGDSRKGEREGGTGGTHPSQGENYIPPTRGPFRRRGGKGDSLTMEGEINGPGRKKSSPTLGGLIFVFHVEKRLASGK